jgi:NADH-quinone oxidoreductase subunit K
MSPLHLCLLLSTVLFCIGLAAVLVRASAILVLLGVELMLNAANLNFIAFWRYGPGGDDTGVIFVLFSIAVAAAEAAVGLALVIALHRHRRTIALKAANQLRG